MKLMDAVGEGVAAGDRKVSGLLFANDFRGMPGTLEEVPKQNDEAMRFTRKRMMSGLFSTNGKICAVTTCNGIKSKAGRVNVDTG